MIGGGRDRLLLGRVMWAWPPLFVWLWWDVRVGSREEWDGGDSLDDDNNNYH